jgi:hypothetical protein
MASEVAERVARHRRRLRASGLRPVELWLYDADSPVIRERLEREAPLIHAHEASDEGRAVQAEADATFDEAMAELDAVEERARPAP